MSLNQFNIIAPYYDRLAYLVFGNSIRKAQTAFLKHVPQGASVLVLGGGTGWWLNELKSINPQAKICFIEASTNMLSIATKNSSHEIFFIHGTEENIPLQKFDVVITYFFLDMFSEDGIKKLIDKVFPRLSENASWIVSDFVNERIWHNIFLYLMYKFFGWLGAIKNKKLIDWEMAIRDRGLSLILEEYYYKNFIKTAHFIKSAGRV